MKQKTEPKATLDRPTLLCQRHQTVCLKRGLLPCLGGVGVELRVHTVLLTDVRPCLRSQWSSVESSRKAAFLSLLVDQLSAKLSQHLENLESRGECVPVS